MHPINHMLVAPLQHQLKVMCLLDILETITRCLQTICFLHILLFDIALFCLELGFVVCATVFRAATFYAGLATLKEREVPCVLIHYDG